MPVLLVEQPPLGEIISIEVQSPPESNGNLGAVNLEGCGAQSGAPLPCVSAGVCLSPALAHLSHSESARGETHAEPWRAAAR